MLESLASRETSREGLEPLPLDRRYGSSDLRDRCELRLPDPPSRLSLEPGCHFFFHAALSAVRRPSWRAMNECLWQRAGRYSAAPFVRRFELWNKPLPPTLWRLLLEWLGPTSGDGVDHIFALSHEDSVLWVQMPCFLMISWS